MILQLKSKDYKNFDLLKYFNVNKTRFLSTKNNIKLEIIIINNKHFETFKFL